MRKNHARFNVSKRRRKLIIASQPGEPIDLTPSRPRDDWDDCLDDTDDNDCPKTQPVSAITRLVPRPTGSRGNSITGPRGRYDPRKHKIGQSTKPRRTSSVRRRRPKATQSFPISPFLGLESAPEVKDKEITSLWACDTKKSVGNLQKKWDQKFRRKVLGAIKRRKLPDDMRSMIGTMLTSRATTVPIMTNPKVRRSASKRLWEGLTAAVAASPDLEVVLVTFISGEWATSHSKPVIELHHSRRAMETTLRAISKNFFAVTELALFNSHSHPEGGQVVQLHGHALVWGPDVYNKSERVAVTHLKKFAANNTDAPQIDVRRVATSEVNLARVCAYLFKPPYRAMTWCPPRDGKKGHMHQSEKGDRFMRYLRMAELYSLLTFEDVCFAGGEGRSIKGNLVTELRRTCEADARGGPIHPDTIAVRWAEVAKALGKDKWALPVIARRP